MTQRRRESVSPGGRDASPQPSSAGKIVKAAKHMRSWAEAALNVAGNVADVSLTIAKVKATTPLHKAAIAKAGRALRQTREAAGMTTEELEKVIGVDDTGLLANAERGAASLPFEVILRLASVLGRHDPVSFAMQLTRSHNPELWGALDGLGIGRLAVQAGRERQLANVYRANDAARRLTDDQFESLLNFTKASFDLAVDFVTESKNTGKKSK